MRPLYAAALLPFICAGCSAEKKKYFDVTVAYGFGPPGSKNSAIIMPDGPVRIPKIVNACGVAYADIKDEFATDGMMDVRFAVSKTEEQRILACLRKELPKGTSLEKAFHQ